MKKFLDNHYLILGIILTLAFILRIININSFPAGLNVDEALDGYLAYSLAETGQDMHGNVWPAHFYAYGWGENITLSLLQIPFIKIFGLTAIALKIPIIIASILAIFFLFLLTKELFNAKIALLAAFMLTISPWHLMLSRLNMNPMLLPMLYLSSLYLIVKTLKTQKVWYLYLSAIPLAISLYTYALSFIWLPMILLAIFIIYYPEVKFKKHLPLWSLLIILLASPIIVFYLKNQFRWIGLTINQWWFFSLPQLALTRFDMVGIFHLKPLSAAVFFIYNYFSYYNLNFLFFHHQYNLKLSTIGFGIMYLWEVVAIFIGGHQIIKLKRTNRSYQLIAAWLLLAPIPAALTIEINPHLWRSVNLLGAWQIISAVGIYYFILGIIKYWRVIVKKTALKIIIISGFLMMIINTAATLYQFYYRFPTDLLVNSSYYSYGAEEIADFAAAKSNQYEKIIFYFPSDKKVYFIYTLFYSKYPPALMIKSAVWDQNDHLLKKNDKFEFYSDDETSAEKFHDYYQQNKGKFLFIVPKDVLSEETALKIFTLPDNLIDKQLQFKAL